MKIALVTNNYKPYSGGVVSAIEVLSNQLAALGHQVFIITLDFQGLGNGVADVVGLVSIVRVFCPIRFSYQAKHIAIPWRPNQAVLQIMRAIKPDIIHSQHPFLLGISALIAGQKLNIPTVFTYHSQYEKFVHHIPLPETFCTSLVRHKLMVYCNQVNGIVAPSSSVAQQLQVFGCKTKIQVIPSGIYPFYLEANLIYKKRKKPFKLLTVSRFAKEKNIYFLLDMFAQLNLVDKNFKFTLAGYGVEQAGLMHHAYQVLGLCPSKVTFIEHPAKNELKFLYQQADLFIFASLAETQGLVLAEAMACGTPVVALRGAGQNDLVIDGKNGFLVSCMQEMINAIRLIAGNTKLHQEMQLAAFESGKLYDPVILTKKLIDFYQEVASYQSSTF